MILKTLNEIISEERYRKNTKYEGRGYTFYKLQEKLKAEAIKWVKNCECEKAARFIPFKLRFCKACQRTIEMNNITEGDLK